MAGNTKTNAMRILEKEKIPYQLYHYDGDEFIDGVTAAEKIGKPCWMVYKTLVTISDKNEIYVFVIPVDKELHLKKAAKAVHEKSIHMLPVAKITQVTGYIKGGCSPVGMKKQYPTVIDQTAESLDAMILSAGKRGMQIELQPKALAGLIHAAFCDVLVDE